MAEGQRYIIRPSDANKGFKVGQACAEHLRQACRRARDEGEAQEVIIRKFEKSRTDPQRHTLWMWHGQVASELAVRTGMRWNKDDVHEVIFLPRFMPDKELVDPETGEVLQRPLRTSDRAPDDEDRSMKQIISDAMDDYLRWVTDMGIEVTVPEEGW